MDNVILTRSHFSLLAASDMQAICQPLFAHTTITCFVHGRYFDDGSCCILTTYPEWHEHRLRQGYITVAPPHPSILSNKFHYLMPSDGVYQPVIHDARNFYNVEHPIDFIEKHAGFFDRFSFGTYAGNDGIIDFYLNNIDLLVCFIDYFKEKAADLMAQANQHRLILPITMRPPMKSTSLSDQARQLHRQNLLTKITGHKIASSHHFSQRELSCLQYLRTGRSIKEIANKLGLSPRTVETYLNNIKIKTGCHSKSQILDFIEQADSFSSRFKT
jgi:DNA-binding CsgD family transcriptional regulator